VNVLIWFWGRTAGGARYSLEVAKALSAIPGLNLYLSLSRQSEFFEEFEALSLPGVHVDTYESFGEMLWQARHLPKYRRQLGRFIRENKIDVVYAPMTHIWNCAIAPVFAKSGARYVLTMHDAITHKGDMERLKNYLLRLDVSASDSCVTLTEAVKQSVHEIYDYPLNNIGVVPHGAFEYGQFEARSLPNNRPLRILFYGRILEYKGLGLLIDALKILAKNGYADKAALEVWGDGDMTTYQPQLDSLTALGASTHIVNRWIDESEIEEIFRRADICALPYVEASQSGVAAIAFATGLPMVATPQPGLIEQLKDGGGLVCHEVSAESFADGLLSLVTRQVLYEQLSRSGLRHAKEGLSWPAIGQKISEVLKGAAHVNA
jgi:glycosyltransferase involved in cell wall biosynthesis